MLTPTTIRGAVTALCAGLILGVFLLQAGIALRDSISSRRLTLEQTVVFGYGYDSSSAAPDSSSATPESSSVAPDSSSAAPDSSSIAPDSSSAIPDSSSVAPDSSSAIPDSSSVVPDSSSAAPDSSSAIPDSSSVAPASSSVAPDSSSAIPDSSSVAPDSSSAIPDSSSVAPDSSSAAPDSSSAIPDSSSVAPDSSSAVADSSSIVPASSAMASSVVSAVPTPAVTGGGGIAGGYTFTPYPVIPSQNITSGCGNGIWEPYLGEECDIGRFNGLGACSITCKNAYCGDGIVQPELEECEPMRTADGAFVSRTCGGMECLPPVCDASGCTGGCRWALLPACATDQQSMRLPHNFSNMFASLLAGGGSSATADATVTEDNSWLACFLESVLDTIDAFLQLIIGK